MKRVTGILDESFIKKEIYNILKNIIEMKNE